jgi:hypothetical protein
MSRIGMREFSNHPTAVAQLETMYRYEWRFVARREKMVWKLVEWRLAAMRRAQNAETNPTLAGELAAELAPNEPGLAAMRASEQTIGPLAERTQAAAAADTHPCNAQLGETNPTASSRTSNEGHAGRVAERTRGRPKLAQSGKTNPSAEEAPLVAASDESRVSSHRENGVAERTQAIPRSEWHVLQADGIRLPRLHPCKTNPSAQSRNCLRINFSPGSRLGERFGEIGARTRNTLGGFPLPSHLKCRAAAARGTVVHQHQRDVLSHVPDGSQRSAVSLRRLRTLVCAAALRPDTSASGPWLRHDANVRPRRLPALRILLLGILV